VVDLELVPAVAEPAAMPGLAQGCVAPLLPLRRLQIFLVRAGALYRKPDDVGGHLLLRGEMRHKIRQHVELARPGLAGRRQQDE
jgi:hypothetical protein